MILVIGANGSMGTRYQAILKHLGAPFICVDIGSKLEDIRDKTITGVIIASPTETHLSFIELFAALGVPILCEKPLSKNKSELQQIKSIVEEHNVNLTMTMQYKMLDQRDIDGDTEYNYFKHGNDGLSWDCIQIIGLARGQVFLREDSPIWKCTLNGNKLSIADMDQAYIDFVKHWLKEPGDDIDELIDIHEKVIKHEQEHGLARNH